MNTVYIVMSSPVGSVHGSIERIFSDRTDAEKCVAYLQNVDDVSGKYEYYMVGIKVFDHFDETKE